MKLHRGKRKVLEHLRILFIWSGAHPRQHLHQVCTHFLPCPFPIACPAHSPPPVLSMLHLLFLTEDMCSGSIFFLSLKLFTCLCLLLVVITWHKGRWKNQICFIDLKPIKVIPPQHLNLILKERNPLKVHIWFRFSSSPPQRNHSFSFFWCVAVFTVIFYQTFFLLFQSFKLVLVVIGSHQ